MKEAFVRLAIGVTVASVLAGCGASQPPIGAQGAMRETSALTRAGISADRKAPSTYYQVLYRFRGGSDGANPYSGLTDVNGTLFGTTRFGGRSRCSSGESAGCGTVYKITTGGSEEVLYGFVGHSDGAYPEASLITVGSTLYGTTSGGDPAGLGTVYTVSTTGSEKVLYWPQSRSDGTYPAGSLLTVKGVLYGATVSGGSDECGGGLGCGTVFTVGRTGIEGRPL